MKKILVLGAGAMGSAFTVPCLDNKNDVILIGTHLENKIIDQIVNGENMHPSLTCKLPKELKIKKFQEFKNEFKEKPDLIVLGVNSKSKKLFSCAFATSPHVPKNRILLFGSIIILFLMQIL